MWSEFGGGIKPGEAPLDALAREWSEETLGAVVSGAPWIRAEVGAGRYLLSIDGRTPSGKGYRSFLLPIPMGPYPRVFALRRQAILHDAPLASRVYALPDLVARRTRPRKEYLEKTEIGWFRGGDGMPKLRPAFAVDWARLAHETPWGRAGFRGDPAAGLAHPMPPPPIVMFLSLLVGPPTLGTGGAASVGAGSGVGGVDGDSSDGSEGEDEESSSGPTEGASEG